MLTSRSVFPTPCHTGSHLVKSRVDSTDFRQPAIWHVTHRVRGCQNCHCLQEEEPAKLASAPAEGITSSCCLPRGRAASHRRRIAPQWVISTGQPREAQGVTVRWALHGVPGRGMRGPKECSETRTGLVLHESNGTHIQMAALRNQDCSPSPPDSRIRPLH